MNEKTRVLLADAADEFRHMAAEMIQQEADMEVVGQTGDGEELLRMVRSLRPQVLVMDLVLSGLDGLGALAQLGQERPRVLVLSAFCPFSVQRPIAGTRSGLFYAQALPPDCSRGAYPPVGSDGGQ